MTEQQLNGEKALETARSAAESLRTALLAVAESADAVEPLSEFGVVVFPSLTDPNEVWSISVQDGSWPPWIPKILCRKSHETRIEDAYYDAQEHDSPSLAGKEKVLADLRLVFDNEAPERLHYRRHEAEEPVADCIKRIRRLEASREALETAIRAVPTEATNTSNLDESKSGTWQARALQDCVYPLQRWPFSVPGRLRPIQQAYPDSVIDFVKLVLDGSPRDHWLSVSDLVQQASDDLRFFRDAIFTSVACESAVANSLDMTQARDQGQQAATSPETPDPESIENLESSTPKLSESDGSWLKQTDSKMRTEAALASLKALRHASANGALKTDDGLFGVDKAGRRWRKKATSDQTVWYWRGTLKGKHRLEENEG